MGPAGRARARRMGRRRTRRPPKERLAPKLPRHQGRKLGGLGVLGSLLPNLLKFGCFFVSELLSNDLLCGLFGCLF